MYHLKNKTYLYVDLLNGDVMHEETLMGWGLSLNEARIYEIMLSLGEVNVNEIFVKSGVHRRNVFDSLNKLIENGLATQFIVN